MSAAIAGEDPVEALLGEHDPLEPLVGGYRALEHPVLLVDQPRLNAFSVTAMNGVS